MYNKKVLFPVRITEGHNTEKQVIYMKHIKNFFHLSREEDGSISKDAVILLISRFLVLALVISYLYEGTYTIMYHEIDSYVLPAEAMQYRHSLTLTQEDIDHAAEDLPQYYINIDEFDDLRSAKLVIKSEDEWLPYYFPSYSIACLPLKMLFQLAGWNQAYAFTLTSAAFVVLALIYMYRHLNVPPLFRLFAVLLFYGSPIKQYIHYLSAEAMMFSLVLISLVMYSNGHSKHD